MATSDPAFGANGIQIIYSTDGVSNTTGVIVKQIGLTKYLVSPAAIGATHKTTYTKVRLANTAAQVAHLPANVATIVVSPFGGGTEHAKKIYSRKVLTVEGHTYNWREASASHIGESKIFLKVKTRQIGGFFVNTFDLVLLFQIVFVGD